LILTKTHGEGDNKKVSPGDESCEELLGAKSRKDDYALWEDNTTETGDDESSDSEEGK
jgi:hypothetical protein